MFRLIRLGDKTTHGGEVVSAAGNYKVMGKNVAREGDFCTCPIKGHGQCQIVGGDPNWKIDGRSVALQGISKTSCGAELISSLGNLTRSFEGDGVASSGLAYASKLSAAPDEQFVERLDFDEHFVLIDKRTGELLEDWAYRIHALGQTAEGTTESTGKTGRVGSDEPEEAVFEYTYPSKIGV